MIHQQKQYLASCAPRASDARDIGMLIANQDVTVDRRRILTLRHLAPSILTPSGHGPLCPVRPDCVWCTSITS